MRLHVETIVLDGMPWLAAIFAELNRMGSQPFVWHVVEGACANTHCTKWMQPQKPRLSGDGTTEFLDALAHDPRVRIYRKPLWDGKLEMVNAPLAAIKEDAVLVEVDSDELYSAEQFRQIVYLFEDDPELMLARFDCRYFVGPGLITTDKGRDDEWLRAWRFKPGMRFLSHEPPNLAGNNGNAMNRHETAAIGLRFDHMSWALPKHVAQKEALYGPRYAGALAGWDRLQRHTEFPTRLKPFFPWSGENVMVDRVPT